MRVIACALGTGFESALRSRLQQDGSEFIACADGATFLDEVARRKPDLMLYGLDPLYYTTGPLDHAEMEGVLHAALTRCERTRADLREHALRSGPRPLPGKPKRKPDASLVPESQRKHEP